MRLIFYFRDPRISGPDDQLTSLAAGVRLEMEERGFLHPLDAPCQDKILVEPDRWGRPPGGLVQALQMAQDGGGLVIMETRGLGRLEPVLGAILHSGVPVFIPEMPTFKQGEPLDGAGIREIRAWNAYQTSKAIAEATKKSMPEGAGGDRGYRPPPEHTTKARDARVEAANKTAEDVAAELFQCYTEAGSYRAAAELANERRIPTPGGGRWWPTNIKRTLSRAGLA